MDKIYERLTLKSFKKSAIGALIVGDFTIVLYLYLKFSDKEVFRRTLDVVLQAMPQAQNQLPPDFQTQLYTLMINTLLTMLGVLLLYHFLIYFLWHKEKQFARGYIAIYAWTAAPLCALAGLTTAFSQPLNALLFFALAALYFYVAKGMKIFPEKKPKFQKKGR